MTPSLAGHLLRAAGGKIHRDPVPSSLEARREHTGGKAPLDGDEENL